MWELSWYRYEVDLSDEAGGARRVAQGAELDELDEADRAVNATADERGQHRAGRMMDVVARGGASVGSAAMIYCVVPEELSGRALRQARQVLRGRSRT